MLSKALTYLPGRSHTDEPLSVFRKLIQYSEQFMPDDIQPDETENWLERLESAKQGDRDSLGWLLQHYWQPLWDQAASGMGVELKSVHSESDIVQETLIDAQNSLRDFRGQTPKELRAWLQTILTNNIRDAWRTTKADKRQPEGVKTYDEVFNLISPDLSASSVFMQNEDEATIEEVLAQLPEHYRVVLRLRHWDSMTFEAIGKSMNKSADSVRQLWYRSVELFAEILDQHDSR